MKRSEQILAAIAILAAGISPSFAQWTNNQNADYVIGQSDFKSPTVPVTPDASSLDFASGVAIDTVNNKLYISDFDDHRILRYSYPITGSQPAAEAVFGQASFTAQTAGVNNNALDGPRGIAVDSTGRLWIADFNNHRILWFNSAHSDPATGAVADGVLGQTNFTNNSANQGGSLDADTLNFPRDVHVSATGEVFVCDRDNGRVLRYDDPISAGSGSSADAVYGPADFTTSTSVNYLGVTTIGTSLFASYGAGSTIFRFDSAFTGSSFPLPGDSTLGSSSGTTQSRFSVPMGLAGDDDGRLYVADFSNNRIMIFDNATSLASSPNADNLLGQALYTDNGATYGQTTVVSPSYLDVDSANGTLIIGSNNARVIVQNASTALPVQIDSFIVD